MSGLVHAADGWSSSLQKKPVAATLERNANVAAVPDVLADVISVSG